MENLSLGLTLMLIGMITVFAILLIVIYLSRLLIVLVNKYGPEEVVPVKTPQAALKAVSATTMNVISAVVAKITGGKGHVKSVEKM